MKVLMIICQLLAVALSNIMFGVVAYYYCEMQWGIKYMGYSAPVGTAFLLAIPFIIGIAALLMLSRHFRKKIKAQ